MFLEAPISFLWKRKPVLPFTYAGIRGRLKGVRKKMLFQRVFFPHKFDNFSDC